MTEWSQKETRDLLSIWGDAQTQKKLESFRNALVWRHISEEFNEFGHSKNLKQIKAKINNLKTTYYTEKNPADYFNRKHFYSVVLQGIVSENYLTLYIW